MLHITFDNITYMVMHVYFNLIDLFQASEDNHYIFICVDHFIRQPYPFLIFNQTAYTVVRTFYIGWVRRSQVFA